MGEVGRLRSLGGGDHCFCSLQEEDHRLFCEGAKGRHFCCLGGGARRFYPLEQSKTALTGGCAVPAIITLLSRCPWEQPWSSVIL